MSLKDYESLLAKFEAIDDGMLVEPNMPVAIMVQESEDLYAWCQEDKEILTKAGLDWTLVEALPARNGACRFSQSQWQKEFKSQQDAQKEWQLKSPHAFDLRNELVHHGFHAFYKLPDLYAKVQKIAEGSGNADMIQDLSDLSVLGLGNKEPFEKINVDIKLFEQAAVLSAEMAALLAKVNGVKQSGHKLKILRDKAYTYVKLAVDEIRRHGQYAFYRNENRRKGYASKYLKKRGNGNSSNTAPQDETIKTKE
jgi:hypothetical protein